MEIGSRKATQSGPLVALDDVSTFCATAATLRFTAKPGQNLPHLPRAHCQRALHTAEANEGLDSVPIGLLRAPAIPPTSDDRAHLLAELRTLVP